MTVLSSAISFSYCIMILAGSGQSVPSSPLSRAVIQRISPLLEVQLKEKGMKLGNPIFLRGFKESNSLELWIQPEENQPFALFKTYPIASYGGKGLGPKLKEGDGKAPEGFYSVNPTQLNPFSKYHLSFNLGYPNKYDRVYNRTGSFLMVHGKTLSIGCYAMTDSQIEEIYTLADQAFRAGQPFFRVHLFPFQLTKVNLNKYTSSLHSKNARWKTFWINLKEGYDFFEKNKLPPNIEVDLERKHYVIK